MNNRVLFTFLHVTTTGYTMPMLPLRDKPVILLSLMMVKAKQLKHRAFKHGNVNRGRL
jgi:hypothetical protein